MVFQWLQSGARPRAEELMAVLANELAVRAMPVGLVLDDYHFIESDAIHNSLDYLLDHAPSNFHLVVATRVDPPLSLARRRARGELAEIRAADLRFSTAEAAEFLNTRLGLGLTAEAAASNAAPTMAPKGNDPIATAKWRCPRRVGSKPF
jgi:LuxR family maltose regulon positive regulatory protein